MQFTNVSARGHLYLRSLLFEVGILVGPISSESKSFTQVTHTDASTQGFGDFGCYVVNSTREREGGKFLW